MIFGSDNGCRVVRDRFVGCVELERGDTIDNGIGHTSVDDAPAISFFRAINFQNDKLVVIIVGHIDTGARQVGRVGQVRRGPLLTLDAGHRRSRDCAKRGHKAYALEAFHVEDRNSRPTTWLSGQLDEIYNAVERRLTAI